MRHDGRTFEEAEPELKVDYDLTKSELDPDWQDVRPAARGAWGSRRSRLVATLIRRGADVHVPDREGRTPLHHARARGFAKIQALLEAAGARS